VSASARPLSGRPQAALSSGKRRAAEGWRWRAEKSENDDIEKILGEAPADG